MFRSLESRDSHMQPATKARCSFAALTSVEREDRSIGRWDAVKEMDLDIYSIECVR